MEARPLKFFAYSPMFGNSHTVLMGALCDALIDKGHEVVSFFLIFKLSNSCLILKSVFRCYLLLCSLPRMARMERLELESLSIQRVGQLRRGRRRIKRSTVEIFCCLFFFSGSDVSGFCHQAKTNVSGRRNHR